MSDKQQKAPYPLRMPDEMRDQLKECAHNNRRSLNAEIVARLELSLLEEAHLGASMEGPDYDDEEDKFEPIYLDVSEDELAKMLSRVHKDFLNKLKKEHGVKIKDKDE
ncbi:hypothetical protein HaloA020_29390 [Halomonas sp. A020]|uniref:Arc family DNA-binding protein n=1 Tax=Halomonas sp. A020 TaxID=2717374 RepID=UPI0024910D0A|nr:Arc family DNA-binding protein [Halomonas sp. A020]BCB62238.1 hypothetical protein HaloA020_29390 [Halomonas sp. A020]